jgi:hypothetical protein
MKAQKTIMLIITFLVISWIGYAQFLPPEDIAGGDTISFEEGMHPLISIDTSTIGLWQIGTPSKPTINSAYDGLRAMITDSLNAYDTSTISSFQLTLPHGKGGTCELVFWHWYETTEGKDGGKIEVSYDMGENWINVIDYNYPYGIYELDNIYSHIDSIENFGVGFSGSSNSWIKSTITWWGYAPDKEDDYFDTTLVRFVFYTDSNPETFDGWAIDRIIALYYKNYWAIENVVSNPAFILYPNPSQNFLHIEAKVYYDQVRITDMTGRDIFCLKEYISELDLSSLSPGIYKISFFIGSTLLFNSSILKISEL